MGNLKYISGHYTDLIKGRDIGAGVFDETIRRTIVEFFEVLLIEELHTNATVTLPILRESDDAPPDVSADPLTLCLDIGGYYGISASVCYHLSLQEILAEELEHYDERDDNKEKWLTIAEALKALAHDIEEVVT